MDNRGIEFLVQGKVQRVFFRKHTKQTADQLGIKGKVYNVSDGTVQGQAYGTSESIDKFIQFLQKGSPKSQVDKVRVQSIEYNYIPTNFTIQK
jgi:acylphosphatase